jgi:mannose-6-phosphate isomerase-like protein (cupin superfamily)
MRVEARSVPHKPDDVAPDGSEVRLLARGPTGGMAHFLLPPGAVSRAVRHRTVEELWSVVSGAGRCGDTPRTSLKTMSN